MSATWYPPLKHTLALLSQLYGAISTGVFEDIARRAVELCVHTLSTGAVGVRRWKTQLHGDLFLVRHLLILREQLMPFDMNLQVVTKTLDFSSTGSALSHMVSNSRSMLRFDSTNSFLQMTRDGLPGAPPATSLPALCSTLHTLLPLLLPLPLPLCCAVCLEKNVIDL
jgi:conserved oligomeric Golgi complex subunit 3